MAQMHIRRVHQDKGKGPDDVQPMLPWESRRCVLVFLTSERLNRLARNLHGLTLTD